MPVLLRFDGDEVRRLRRAAISAATEAQRSGRLVRPMLLLRWEHGLRLEAPGTRAEPGWAIGWESWQADLERRADEQWGERRRPTLVLAAQRFAACDDPSCLAVELALATPAGPVRFAFLRRV